MELQQRVQVLRALEVDAPTAPAITARRTSPWHKPFAPESHAAVPSVASGNVNRCLVNKHEESQMLEHIRQNWIKVVLGRIRADGSETLASIHVTPLAQT